MQRRSSNYTILQEAIERSCFVTKEARAISLRSETQMSWLFDFRKVLLKSEILNAYAELFWIRHRDTPSFQVCGVEMAAIPLVAAIVMKFHEKGRPINGFIIRKSRKKTGLLHMVEGSVTEEPVIIVDDLINSGGSVTRQIEIIKDLGKEIGEVFIILRFRDISYYSTIQQAGVSLCSIFELNDFRQSLGVANVLTPATEKQTQSPFEEKSAWYFRGDAPNYFYVVPKSGPIVSDDKVFFGTDDGTFFACKTATGEIVWTHKIPFGSKGKFILSTPAICRDLVFFGAYDGNFYALQKNTGKRVWTFMEADWIGSSPCVADDLDMVFVGLEFGLLNKRGGVVGLNVHSGEKMWEYRTPKLTHGSPAYSKKFQVVGCGSNDGVLSLLDAKTGQLRWDFQTDGDIKYAPCFSDEHGVVVVLGHGEIVYVLDIQTGKIVSSYKMDFGGYSTPLVMGKKVICTSFDKHVHCFDILTGKLIWKYNTGARSFATPALINGKIYVGSNNARLLEIDPQTGEVSGIFYTRERIMNKVSYDPQTKIFFIPTFANEIFALRIREAP